MVIKGAELGITAHTLQSSHDPAAQPLQQKSETFLPSTDAALPHKVLNSPTEHRISAGSGEIKLGGTPLKTAFDATKISEFKVPPSAPEQWRMFGNESVYGSTPRADAIVLSALAKKPKLNSTYLNVAPLKFTLAQLHALQPEQITIGNGSNELIKRITTSFVKPGGTVIASAHSYTFYD
ncbi:MAG: hypothetical protein V4623_04325, partial [Pseudomonadota bacterium]